MPDKNMRRSERAEAYGLNVRQMMRLLGVPRSEIPILFGRQGLPIPTHSAVSSWITRNSITAQWLAVLALSLEKQQVKFNLADFVENREIAGN